MAKHESSAQEMFRTQLDDWRARQRERAIALAQQEEQHAQRNQLRAELAQRKEFEAKKEQLAAERKERNRREAAQFFSWKTDAVLVRRAEEHARATEYRQWRDTISQLRQGTCAPLTPRAEMSRTVKARSSFSQSLCDAMPAQSIDLQTTCSSMPTTAELREPAGKSRSTHESGMLMPEDECDLISESEKLRLAEETAWKYAVARNRTVLDELQNRQRSEANSEGQAIRFPMPTWYPDEARSTAEKASVKGQPFTFRVPTRYSGDAQSTAVKTTASAPVRGGSVHSGSRLRAMKADLSRRYEPLGI